MAFPMAERDLRKAQRIAAELPMKVTLDDGSHHVIKTWDFSSSGVFIEATADILARAQTDALVQVQFQGTNYTPPIMTARIIRVTEKGLALKLEETVQEGDASHLPDERQ